MQITPAYVCYQSALRHNLTILESVQNERINIYLALKGFAFSLALPEVFSHLAGASASGVWEALMAAKYGAKHICSFSPAFSLKDMAICAGISDSLVLNSIAQYDLAAQITPTAAALALAGCIKDERLDDELAQDLLNRATHKAALALRCNPCVSSSPKDMYDPCGRFSRLGVRAPEFAAALKCDDFAPAGLHVHALCEQDFAALVPVWQAFERDFLQPLYASGRSLEFINLGGGHHISKDGYDTASLRNLLEQIADKYHCKVILEPGEAVGWRTGVLRARVCDIVQNEQAIAILDCSAEAHMPDTILMPYTSEIKGARIAAERNELKNLSQAKSAKSEYCYILAANTCLAGDVMGAYAFTKELKIGDVVEFEDQIHYSIVKNTTFNGVRLPALVYALEDGSEIVREFYFSDYERRN